MIATKGQLVTLTNAALEGRADHVGRARVVEVVYTDQPEGERGVRLDRALAGEIWWLESSLEAAPAD